ncbi:MAG: hypothetical protein ACK5SI_00475 [Planctomycetia bacterium]
MPTPGRFRACLRRRRAGACATLLIATLIVGFGRAPVGTAREPAGEAREPAAADNAATLADRLKAELRVRLPEDEEYCDEVAALVERGRLPERLVTSTRAWAVAKKRQYPFPVFRRALETKAARLGLMP